MAKFKFTAHDRYSKVKTGNIEADSQEEASQMIRNDYNLFPMKVEQVDGKASSASYTVPAEEAVGKPLVYNPSMRMSELGDQAELTASDLAKARQGTPQKKQPIPQPVVEERVKMGSRSVMDVGQLPKAQKSQPKQQPHEDDRKMEGFGIDEDFNARKSEAPVEPTHHERVCAALGAVHDTMAIVDGIVASLKDEEPDPLVKAWLNHRDKFHMELLKAALVKSAGF